MLKMNKKNYGVYQRVGDMQASFEFHEGDDFPKYIPISTPLTFAFLGTDLVLTEKKTGKWDILGGKMEEGEDWISALKRESLEFNLLITSLTSESTPNRFILLVEVKITL